MIRIKAPFCGHENEVQSSTDVADLVCRQLCGKPLECGHLCVGTCGECRRGRLHKKCDEDCKRILICGHECKDKCSKACPPCPEPCGNRCSHNRCSKAVRKNQFTGRTCGEPCPQCVEKCAWSCPHEKCDLRCFEPCKRRRCTEKCPKKLECEHDCIGVCGEPCPKMCRVCNKEEFDEMCADQMVPIDDDEKETAVFVQLDECKVKHLFEVSALDTWFDTETNKMLEEQKQEIKLLQCPKCNIPVRTTQRYGAVTKQCLIDVQKVKIKQNGVPEDLAKKRDALKEQLKIIKSVDGEASKAIKVVADLVVKPDTNSLNRNRLANLETLIRFLYEMVSFKDKDLENLKDVAFTGSTTMPADSRVKWDRRGPLNNEDDSIGPGNALAIWFVDSFYPSKRKSGLSVTMALAEIIENETNSLFDWIARNAAAPSDQMLKELAYEWRRTIIFAQLIEFLIIATNRETKLSPNDWGQVEQVVKTMNGENAFDSLVEKNVKDVLEILIKHYGRKSELGVSEKEKIEIISAMGLTRGHWFKCPNGHIYAIGECGGATEHSICPECKEAIGGSGHRLLDSNAVAPEMDGASQSAYEANVVGDHDFAMRLQQRLNM